MGLVHNSLSDILDPLKIQLTPSQLNSIWTQAATAVPAVQRQHSMPGVGNTRQVEVTVTPGKSQSQAVMHCWAAALSNEAQRVAVMHSGWASLLGSSCALRCVVTSVPYGHRAVNACRRHCTWHLSDSPAWAAQDSGCPSFWRIAALGNAPRSPQSLLRRSLQRSDHPTANKLTEQHQGIRCKVPQTITVLTGMWKHTVSGDTPPPEACVSAGGVSSTWYANLWHCLTERRPFHWQGTQLAWSKPNSASGRTPV